MILYVFVASGAIAGELPESVRTVLSAHGIPMDSVGILVRSLDGADPLVALNVDTPLNPASAIKLVSTFVALEVLGPTYTWPTEVYALGPISGDTLEGDLLFKGYGDPNLVVEELWRLLGSLRTLGIKHIAGDLVIDDTYFAVPDIDPGAFDKKPFRLYNVIPNAFLVNFKAVEFRFTTTADRKVTIQTIPALPNLSIQNNVTGRTGDCRDHLLRINMHIPDPKQSDHVVFSGQLPTSCREYRLSRSVLEPQTYAYGVFKTLWAQWDGTLGGGVRPGSAPTKSDPLLVWRSRPLAESIRGINKWSNNVMTRMLLYTLAATSYDPPVTREQGVEVIEDYFNTHQIDTTGLVIDNGAGLSRKTRISARQMTELLHHAYRSPFMPEFIASMSIAGLDGTTRRRFRHRPETGRMHLKTGQLNGAVAIAGYVLAQSGKTFSVVLLVNDKGIQNGPGRQLQDALLSWVYRQ